jgi:hypothetical protein
MISPGKVRVIATTFTSVGAGASTVPLRPDDGKEWEILYAIAYHGDAAGVLCDWVFTDPGSGGSVGLSGGGISINPNVVHPLGAIVAGGPTQLLAPLKATRARYLGFVFTASAAGKVGTVRALVLEYAGLQDG